MSVANKSILFLCVAWMAVASLAHADSLGVSEIENFHLTNTFLHKWQAYQAVAKKDPCKFSVWVISKHDNVQTLDQMAAAFDASPGVHQALSKVGLTAREYMTGHFLLANANGREQLEQHPGMSRMLPLIHSDGRGLMDAHVSPEDMAFFRKHKKAIHQSEALITPAMMWGHDKVLSFLGPVAPKRLDLKARLVS